jgi:hypothetical protein
MDRFCGFRDAMPGESTAELPVLVEPARGSDYVGGKCAWE